MQALLVEVQVELLQRLDEMARAKGVSRSRLVRDALALFAGVENRPQEIRRGDVDGRETEALAIIKADPDASLRQLVERLEDVGIRRGKTWISDKRYALKGSGSKHSADA